MSLSNDQELTLLLAGTVALPSPPPATGTVDVVTSEDGDSADPDDLYVRVTHRVGSRMSLVRTVRLADVRVIRGVWPDQEHEAPLAKTPREFRRLAETQGRSGDTDRPWLTKAVVYVIETAPVLLRVEVGMTAAESADYYPPIEGGGRVAGGGLGVSSDSGARVGQRKGQFLKEFLGARGAVQGHRPESYFAFNPCTPLPAEPPGHGPSQ